MNRGFKTVVLNVYHQKDKLWLLIWLLGVGSLWLWDEFFLNKPAFVQVQTAFLNTFIIAILVIVSSVMMSWWVGVGIYFLENSNRYFYIPVAFLLNLIRSVPQIVGILIGYVIITLLIQGGVIRNDFYIMLLMAFAMSLFVFLEIVDLIRERINYYKKLDFYNAMLCCGIKESRIINLEILWKNSLSHILNKLIAVFGIAIFLQCSIDFTISVGLSTDVSLVNFPVTLGNMLAKIDSKQDILAIGNTFSDISYLRKIFFEHLQGITIAFLIVFTLLCVYKISNGFAKRHQL